MYRLLSIVSIMFVLSLSSVGDAVAGQTGSRTVNRLACFGSNTLCFVILSGNSFGPAGCNSNQLRWDAKSDSGKHLLATLMLAKSMGNTVNVSYSDTQCFAGGQFPSINWVNVLEN